MKPCPYCAEEIQDAAAVCRHCNRDLTTGAYVGPGQAQPQAAPTVAPKKKTGCVAMGCGALLGLFVLSAIISGLGRQAGVPTQPAAAQPTAAQLAAVREAAARGYPAQKAELDQAASAAEEALKKKEWLAASQRIAGLVKRTEPLFASSIASDPDVVALKGRVDALREAIAKAQPEIAKAEAAAKAKAEASRRAAWKPDPAMMSIRCARYAKQGILDGEAEFAIVTFAKAGAGVYSMQGRVIGHNAFNARIAKRAVCKVRMDWPKDTEMYETTILD